MDADKPKPSINLAQKELDKGRAQWTAEKARRTAESDALNRTRSADSLDTSPIRS